MLPFQYIYGKRHTIELNEKNSTNFRRNVNISVILGVQDRHYPKNVIFHPEEKKGKYVSIRFGRCFGLFRENITFVLVFQTASKRTET
jgi:hypothetical protein